MQSGVRDAGSSAAERWFVPLLIVFAILMRAPFFGSPAVHIDEQFYLVVADKWVRHGLVPFVDIWDRKPLGTFLLYAIPVLIAKDPILGYQLLATGFAIGASLIVLELGRLLASARAGFMAAAIYIVALGLMEGPGGQTPVFYNFFVAAATMIIVRCGLVPALYPRRGIVAAALGASLLFGLAIQIKYVAVLEACALSLFFLAAIRVRYRTSWEFLATLAAAMMAAGIIPTAAVGICYAAIGHWSAFFDSNVASIFVKHLWNLPMGEFLRRFRESSLFCIFFLPFAAYAVLSPRDQERDPTKRWIRIACILWIVAAMPGALMLGNPTRHYFLPTLAPLALLAALGLTTLEQRADAIGAAFRRVASRAAGFGTLAAILIVPVCATLVIAYENPRERGEMEDVYAIAAAIERYADPGGCIFVFNRLPILYLLTDRCAPTIYAFPNHLSEIAEVRTPGGERLAELARVLNSRPTAIYVRRPYTPDIAPEAIELFEATLAAHYELVYVRRGHLQLHDVYVPRAERANLSSGVLPPPSGTCASTAC